MSFIPFSILLGVGGGIFLGFALTLGIRFPLLTMLFEKDKNAANERKDTAKGICFGLAVLFAIAGFFIAIYSAYFVTSGIRTEGVISEIRETKDEEGLVHHKPFYRYSDKNGGTHLDNSNMKVGTEYKIGDKVPVIYLADSPSDSRLNYYPNHWFAPILLFGITLGIGLVPGISSRLFKFKTAEK